mmetsp:Transcript_49321/g.138701  ORF Transcript_49321/g.138701 Transcript_49321/m.138701 type:complete len:242 (-) Transcript_49321:1401-2126(-)
MQGVGRQGHIRVEVRVHGGDGRRREPSLAYVGRRRREGRFGLGEGLNCGLAFPRLPQDARRHARLSCGRVEEQRGNCARRSQQPRGSVPHFGHERHAGAICRGRGRYYQWQAPHHHEKSAVPRLAQGQRDLWPLRQSLGDPARRHLGVARRHDPRPRQWLVFGRRRRERGHGHPRLHRRRRHAVDRPARGMAHAVRLEAAAGVLDHSSVWLRHSARHARLLGGPCVLRAGSRSTFQQRRRR